jgi:DNA-binding HxlR family transcriptional regulator
MAATINAPRGNRAEQDRGVASGSVMPPFPEAASTCPVELAIEVIGGRWKLLILRWLFLRGAQRFNHLLHSIEGISGKELTRNLRELENGGIVEHRAASIAGAPGLYSLSELGMTLMPVFREIGSFGERLKKRKIPGHSMYQATKHNRR